MISEHSWLQIVLTKIMAMSRIGATCNKCGDDLEISPLLLGTKKEWQILKLYSCKKCMKIYNKEVRKTCVIEGCKTAPASNCGEYCWVHVTQAQRDKLKKKRMCIRGGCKNLKWAVNIVLPKCLKHRRTNLIGKGSNKSRVIKSVARNTNSGVAVDTVFPMHFS